MGKIALAAILVSCAVCGCGFSKDFLGKDYDREQLKNKLFYFEPVKKDQIRIEILEHFKDDFQPKEGADFQQILADTLNNKMLWPFKQLKGNSVFVTKQLGLSDSDYFEFEKSLHGGTEDEIAFRFKIPKASALNRNSIPADFCLVTKEFDFEIRITGGTNIGISGLAGGAIGTTNTTSRFLNVDLKYVIWDYRKNDFVSFGLASGQASAKFVVIKGDWITAIEKSFVRIIHKSPLRKLLPEKKHPQL